MPTKVRDPAYKAWIEAQIEAIVTSTDDEDQPMLASFLLMAAVRCFEASYGSDKLPVILAHALDIRNQVTKNDLIQNAENTLRNARFLPNAS